MVFDPNDGNPIQAIHPEILRNGAKGNGVVSGLAPTANSTLGLAVASGTIIVDDGLSDVSVSSATPTLSAADASNPRIDLIFSTSGGVVTVREGIPSATPKIESLNADEVGIASVLVAANAIEIFSADIQDLRVNVIDREDHFDTRYKAIFGEIVASGEAATSSTSEVELVTSGSLVGLNDETKGSYELRIFARYTVGGGSYTLKTRVNDGTNDADATITAGATEGTGSVFNVNILQGIGDNTVYTMMGPITVSDASITAVVQNGTGLDADWIKSAHTISLRAVIATAGTVTVRWELIRFNPL